VLISAQETFLIAMFKTFLWKQRYPGLIESSKEHLLFEIYILSIHAEYKYYFNFFEKVIY